MSENLRNYTKAIYAMDAIVQRVPDAVWGQRVAAAIEGAPAVLGYLESIAPNSKRNR